MLRREATVCPNLYIVLIHFVVTTFGTVDMQVRIEMCCIWYVVNCCAR
jgi:hypothetical protein